MFRLAVPLLAAVGCAAATSTTPTPSAAAPATSTGSVDGARELTGVLTYAPLPETKSVEAYEGVEFRVAGTPVESSESVSRDMLMGYDGKSVTVRCTMRTPPPPAMHESYPVGMDGRALPRPARCTVSSITSP
jgi:hypothetical protein